MGRPTFAGWQKVGGPYHPLPPPLREWVAPSAPELRQRAKGRKLRKVQYNATGAKWAMCIYFVTQSMLPLPRSFLAAEPMDPRERDGLLEKGQNEAGCSGVCRCQVRAYDKKAGAPSRPLQAGETSRISTFPYTTPVQ